VTVAVPAGLALGAERHLPLPVRPDGQRLVGDLSPVAVVGGEDHGRRRRGGERGHQEDHDPETHLSPHDIPAFLQWCWEVRAAPSQEVPRSFVYSRVTGQSGRTLGGRCEPTGRAP